MKRISLPEWVTAGAAFLYYWVMALYKLTDAPIWQDEAMEFYCSLPVRGTIRGVTEYATMYERMAHIQQQPPLYNWFLCLWLQISEDEWWFRFSSAVLGFFAVLGLYLLIRKLMNKETAAFCVVICSSIYIWMYYVKEASEYVMLIMFLFYTIYLFFLLMEQITVKRLIGFTFLCVACVYTHYGAAFSVMALAVTLLFYFLKNKEMKAFKISLASYAAAVIAAGVPMIVFFIMPQSGNAVSTIGSDYPIEITGNNIILDFFDSMMWVLRWCMLDYDRDWDKLTWAIWIILFILILLGIFVFIKTQKKHFRYFIGCNVLCFFIYYVPTTLTIYAYGWFGNRYNLFIFPMWFVLIAIILYETLVIFQEQGTDFIKKSVPYLKAAVVAAMVLFCMYGVKRIDNHWAKMDLRTVVSAWYGEKGYELPTFLDFHQRYGFVYYFTHNTNYEESQWEKIYANMELETYNASTEEYIALLNKVYGKALPDELLIVTGQWNDLMDAVEELGYQVDAIVDINAKLYKVHKE